MHTINEYQYRLDVQRFLWPISLYYPGPLSCIFGCITMDLETEADVVVTVQLNTDGNELGSGFARLLPARGHF